jgi:hypothetical protein
VLAVVERSRRTPENWWFGQYRRNRVRFFPEIVLEGTWAHLTRSAPLDIRLAARRRPKPTGGRGPTGQLMRAGVFRRGRCGTFEADSQGV